MTGRQHAPAVTNRCPAPEGEDKRLRNRAAVWAGFRRRRIRATAVLCVMGALCILTGVLLMTVGHTHYPLSTVFRVLTGSETGDAVFTIRTLRFPRLVAGVFSGFAFGMAGSVFQTNLRNPLANPNIIGITSASSVGAVFCFLILHTGGSAAFLGSILMAVLSAALIYLLAHVRRYTTGRLILIGIGFQAMMNSLISYLMLIGNERDLAGAMRWMSGSLNGVQMITVWPLMAVMAVCVPLILIDAKDARIMELGEEASVALGVRTGRARMRMMGASVILTAVATATTGPIAFVSFLSGPIAKRLMGHGNSSPLAAGIFGALLVTASDFAGQNLFEIRFPVGVITGLLGAPYLIFLLIRMNRRGAL